MILLEILQFTVILMHEPGNMLHRFLSFFCNLSTEYIEIRAIMGVWGPFPQE